MSQSATPTTDLAGKVAIVTGASRGFGRGIVESLAAQGVRVVALARSEAQLAELARTLPGVTAVAADATDEATAERLLREHNPDLLVLSVGAEPVLAPFFEQTWDQFSTNWEVDTKSTYVWLRQLMRSPDKAGRHVIVISSGAAVQGSPVSGGYAGAKRTQWFLADYAVSELARQQRQVRMHCILPILSASTAIGRAGIAAYATRAGITEEAFIGRFGPPLTPALVGAAVVQLATAPAQWGELAYRLSGHGLASLQGPPK